jgi:two-component system, NarL family, invasion response regulator UvrY
MSRILIAHDHAIAREGLAQLLAAGPDGFSLDQAGSGVEALDKAWNNDYDLILLDAALPGRGGGDVLGELQGLRPGLPVLIVSRHTEEHHAVRAFRAGAAGYLTQGSASDELLGAVRKVIAGGKYISCSLAEKLAFSLINGAGKPLHEALSAREYQVMRMLASGKTIRATADEMSLSVKTINTYRTRLLRKMRMKDNAELIHYAKQNDLLE